MANDEPVKPAPTRVVTTRAADGPQGPPHSGPQPGIALCLSGGGYRAMVFHIGVLWRLNELGYLAKLDRVSSVSGGSITAGVLAVGWGGLGFDGRGVAANFKDRVVAPLLAMAGETIDVLAGLIGFVPGLSASGRVEAAYQPAGARRLSLSGPGSRLKPRLTVLMFAEMCRFGTIYRARGLMELQF
jgi:hypothetical protein